MKYARQPHRRAARHGGFGAIKAVPNLPPSKRPRVDLWTVACPDCDAAVDHRCVTAAGTETTNVHASRRRLAVRAYNQRQGT